MLGWAADVVATVSTNATAFRDIIQPDGKIVAIGTSDSGGQVVRYNAGSWKGDIHLIRSSAA